MLSDIEIARSVKLRPINEVAEELGLKEEQIENYGRYIAKVETGAIDKSKFAGHHLILSQLSVLPRLAMARLP